MKISNTVSEFCFGKKPAYARILGLATIPLLASAAICNYDYQVTTCGSPEAAECDDCIAVVCNYQTTGCLFFSDGGQPYKECDRDLPFFAECYSFSYTCTGGSCGGDRVWIPEGTQHLTCYGGVDVLPCGAM